MPWGVPEQVRCLPQGSRLGQYPMALADLRRPNGLSFLPLFPRPSSLSTCFWLPAGSHSNPGDPFPKSCTQHSLCLAGGITVEWGVIPPPGEPLPRQAPWCSGWSRSRPGRESGAVCCSEAPLSRKVVCLCISCCWARLPTALASVQEEMGRGHVHPVGRGPGWAQHGQWNYLLPAFMFWIPQYPWAHGPGNGRLRYGSCYPGPLPPARTDGRAGTQIWIQYPWMVLVLVPGKFHSLRNVNGTVHPKTHSRVPTTQLSGVLSFILGHLPSSPSILSHLPGLLLKC